MKPLWSGNCRMPSPPGELMIEIYSNYPQAVWEIANGKLPVLAPVAEYGAEIILTSQWHNTHELCVEFPKDVMDCVKLKNHTKRDGTHYCIPNDNGGFFGAVVATGDTIQSAMDKAMEVAESIVAEGFEYSPSVFDKAKEAIESGEKFGVKF